MSEQIEMVNLVQPDLSRHTLVTTAEGQLYRVDGHMVLFDNVENCLCCVLENEENLRLFGLLPEETQLDTAPSSETAAPSSETSTPSPEAVSPTSGASILDAAESWKENVNKDKVQWTRNATLALISSWKANQPNFESTLIRNEVVWRMIAEDVKATGLMVTALQTENKWKNLRKGYMAVRDHNSKSGNAPKTCKFYKELDEVFAKSPSVAPVALASSMRKRPAPELSSDDEPTQEKEANECGGQEVGNGKKSKQSKLNRELQAWSKTLREDAKEREMARERRHEALIATQNRGISAFTEVMSKLLEKL